MSIDTIKFNNNFMLQAFEQAKLAYDIGEVPVGAVVVHQGQVIAKGHNLVEIQTNPVAHAELLVIQEAAKLLGDVRLDSCDLYVTLEPCAMCAQAISHARIQRLYFGAFDPKSGGVDHGARIFSHATCHFKPDVYGGIQEDACRQLLQSFFSKLRQK